MTNTFHLFQEALDLTGKFVWNSQPAALYSRKLRRNLTAPTNAPGSLWTLGCNAAHTFKLRTIAAQRVMDRRWRGPQGQEALKSLSSFHEYKDRLTELPARLRCATTADVYSVYSCLHAAGKPSQVGCDPGGAFIYLQVTHQAQVR